MSIYIVLKHKDNRVLWAERESREEFESWLDSRSKNPGNESKHLLNRDVYEVLRTTEKESEARELYRSFIS